MAPLDYKSAGVDIAGGEQLVDAIKRKVRSTYGERVAHGVGGFASLYHISDDKMLAAGTDGVGTKLRLALELDLHNTIGIDLVAMCVNDIICTGATPLFFLDYLACGKLKLGRDEQIIDGIVEGCKQSKMALIGGETAEMPGSYPDDEYDLAGFAVGEVATKKVIDGSKISEGDYLMGIASSGFHSNGYSLLRRLIKQGEESLQRQLLTPTTIYCQAITTLVEDLGESIKGVAHITGGGIHNISRLNDKFDYQLSSLPSLDELPECFATISERSKLPANELYSTFNMGVGMVVITDSPKKASTLLSKLDHRCWEIGRVTKGDGEVQLPN
jgi:phosphoribosylformylglycinamidine cyclo-ligase